MKQLSNIHWICDLEGHNLKISSECSKCHKSFNLIPRKSKSVLLHLVLLGFHANNLSHGLIMIAPKQLLI